MKSKGISEGTNPITKAAVKQAAVSLANLAEERDCQYYNELESLLKDSEGIEDFQESVKVFIEKITSDVTLDADNKEALLAGAYVFSASADYWSENIGKWEEAVSATRAELTPMTKSESYALRVVDDKGQGIMEARVHPEGQDVLLTTTGGYIYNHTFNAGQNILILHNGYKTLAVNYTGPGMNVYLERDNSGTWANVVLCVLADGAAAVGAS